MCNDRYRTRGSPQLNERYSDHFHNNVKRWWKEIGEEQHLGPLWTLMTLRGREKGIRGKRWTSLNIFFSLCIRYQGHKWLRVTWSSAVEITAQAITHFLPRQQKSSGRKSSTRGYRVPSQQHIQAASLKICCYKAFSFHSWVRVVFTKNALHCEPWTKRYCCVLVSAWQ